MYFKPKKYKYGFQGQLKDYYKTINILLTK